MGHHERREQIDRRPGDSNTIKNQVIGAGSGKEKSKDGKSGQYGKGSTGYVQRWDGRTLSSMAQREVCCGTEETIIGPRGGIGLGRGAVSVMAEQAVRFDEDNRMAWDECEDRGKRQDDEERIGFEFHRY